MMFFRKSGPRNQRRRRSKARRQEHILEVKVRAKLATQQRNRKIAVWSLRFLIVIALASACFFGGREALRRFLWENPEYAIAVIEIQSDGVGISREMVLAETGLKVGENIFNVSLAEVRKALVDFPQIESAEVKRMLPNKIAIEIIERRPIAWLVDREEVDPSTSESAFLIDSKGIVFKPKRSLTEYLRLPVVFGVPTGNFLAGEVVSLPEVQAALELVQQARDTGRFFIQGINLSKGYCMIVTDSQKKQIIFPLDEIDRHLIRLAAVMDYAIANRKEIQTVNLMVERNIPITEVGSTPPPETLPAESASKGEKNAETGSLASVPAAVPSSKTPVAKPVETTPKTTSKKTTSPKEAFLKSRSGSSSTPKTKSSKEQTGSKTSNEKPSVKPSPTPKAKQPDVRRALPVIRGR